MQDSKGREATAHSDESEEQLRERQAEATNAETLSDVEAEQKIGDSQKTSERDAPAPDAQPGEPRQKRDDAGPM